MAEGEQKVTAGLAGADVNLRFQRLLESKTPILLSIHQLEELDTVLYVKERKADFKTIKQFAVPLNKSEKGASEDLTQGLAEERSTEDSTISYDG
eukprot:5996811-Pyramimonas_sp.AAC.1